jgi:hypothetical protein
VSLTPLTTGHLPLNILRKFLAVGEDIRNNRLVSSVIDTAHQRSAVSLTPLTSGQRCH